MPDEKVQYGAALKTVAVRLPGAKVLDREPTFLFAARQVEEVLLEAVVQPLPFAPDWLAGLCAWRQQALPVIDLPRLYNIAFMTERHFYIVARIIIAGTGDNLRQQEKKMLRCVLKVSDRIAAGELPGRCEIAATEQTGMDIALVKGMFTHEDRLLILPELRPVLRAPVRV